MSIKKINVILFSILITLVMSNITLFANVNLLDLDDVDAECAAIIDMETGRLLYGKNENKKQAIASTTKIMTSLITLEQDDIDSYFEVDPKAIKIEGTSMGLLEGDKVSLRTLAVGMLLPSGNDAAEVAAIKIAGSRKKFLDLMNEKAKSFGCNNTHFATTSGLDDDDHYSTASDMVKIAKHALLNEDFAKICNQEYETIEYGNPPYKRTLKNHNKLLTKYDYCIGVKTGYTDNAGKCLVSAAKKDDICLIIATLNNKNNMYETHENMYEQAFNKLSKTKLTANLPVNNVKVVGGETIGVPVETKFNLEIPLIKGEENKLKHKINLKKFLLAPVKKGSVIGEINYYIDGNKIVSNPITTMMDVKAKSKNSFWEKILKNFHINKMKKDNKFI